MATGDTNWKRCHTRSLMVDVKEVVFFFPTFFIIIIIIILFYFTKGDLSSFLIRVITSKILPCSRIWSLKISMAEPWDAGKCCYQRNMKRNQHAVQVSLFHA